MSSTASGAILLVLTAAVLLAAAVAVLGGFRRFRASIQTALEAVPDIRITGTTPAGLTAAVAGHPVTLSLIRPFLTGRGAGAAAIADTLRASVPPARIPPLPLVQDRILPILKRTDRMPPSSGYRPENRVVRAPFDGEVILAYVIEGQLQMTYVTEGMLRSWKTDLPALHALALTNMRAKTEHLLMEIEGPRRDYIALDGFDAARLLVADLLIPSGISDPVLAIPHEHTLLVRPGETLAALAAEAEQARGPSSLPLTSHVYRWTPAGPKRVEPRMAPMDSS